jgi:hypothetical protein
MAESPRKKRIKEYKITINEDITPGLSVITISKYDFLSMRTYQIAEVVPDYVIGSDAMDYYIAYMKSKIKEQLNGAT